jgi:signal transduction histidine kinase/CheY-like chemotaxis protein
MNSTPIQIQRRQSGKGFGAPPQFKAVCFTYGVPLLFLAAALAIHFRILEPLELGAPLGFMSLPVVIAAIYFGFRPAMLVTVLGGVVIAYYLDLHWDQMSHIQQVRIGSYLGVGTLVSWIGGQNKSTQAKLAELAIATEKRKDDFLAMLGHELRNPLSGISSAARLLVHPALDQRGLTENANIIHRQAAHMTNLISDLLDVSRVTRGQVVIEKAPVDWVAKIHAAVEQVSDLVENREHQLILNLPTSPVWVMGDKTRLVQVVTNLLANAARYTPHKGVLTLTLSTTKDQAHLSVQDNGIGITPEFAANVFEIFVQAKRSTDGVMGGLGLGLSLVKSMVEAHGGKVSVYSAGLGQGSTFSVTLPLSAEAQAQAQAQCVTEAKSLDILLVDDNRDAAQPLAMFLEFEGHRVVVAHNGQEALQKAEERRFDVAILDIGLPDTDGYTLARQFKAIPQQSGARLVAVTGYGTAQDIAIAYEAGFDQHIVKPIDIDLLLKDLEHLAQRVSPALSAPQLACTS